MSTQHVILVNANQIAELAGVRHELAVAAIREARVPVRRESPCGRGTKHEYRLVDVEALGVFKIIQRLHRERSLEEMPSEAERLSALPKKDLVAMVLSGRGEGVGGPGARYR